MQVLKSKKQNVQMFNQEGNAFKDDDTQHIDCECNRIVVYKDSFVVIFLFYTLLLSYCFCDVGATWHKNFL